MKKILSLTRLILLVLCLFLSSSCCSNKQLPTEIHSHQQTDSTSTEIHWRKVFIHDTVPIFIPVEKHSSVGEDSSHLETDFAISDAFTDSTGKLHHTLENKARQIDVPVSGSAIVSDTNRYESHVKVDTIRVPEPYPVYVERELTDWQQFKMNGFWWLSVGLLGYVLWRTKKWWTKRTQKI